MILEKRVSRLEQKVKELEKTNPTPSKLKKLRKEANLSIDFAAKSLNIHVEIYKLFEKGLREIPREIYLRALTEWGISKK